MESEVRLGFRPDDPFRSLMKIIREDPESPHRQLKEEKEKKVPAAPQNMRTVEEPEVPAEKVDDLENYDKEDFNTPGKKVKSKTPDNPNLAVKEEPENKQQMLKDSKQEGDLFLCNNCCKTFRALEESCPHCFSNIVEKIVAIQEASPVQGDWLDDKNQDSEPEQEPEHEMETIAGEEDWDYTFRYSHNQIGGNPLEDKSGNPIIWHTNPRILGGKKIQVFTDYQENWVKDQGAIPVRSEPVGIIPPEEEPETKPEHEMENESKLSEAEDISALQARRLEIEQAMLEAEKEYMAGQNRMSSEVDALNQQIKAAGGETEEEGEKKLPFESKKLHEQEEDNVFIGEAELNLSVQGVPKGVDHEQPKKIPVTFRIEEEYRSWGLKDINVSVVKPISFEWELIILNEVGDEVKRETKEVTIDPSTIKYSWDSGAGLTTGEITVEVDMRGNVKSCEVSFLYWNPER